MIARCPSTPVTNHTRGTPCHRTHSQHSVTEHIPSTPATERTPSTHVTAHSEHTPIYRTFPALPVTEHTNSIPVRAHSQHSLLQDTPGTPCYRPPPPHPHPRTPRYRTQSLLQNTIPVTEHILSTHRYRKLQNAPRYRTLQNAFRARRSGTLWTADGVLMFGAVRTHS